MKQHKQNCSKVRWGIFSFFSSTNVETKNVCPIAYNGLQIHAVSVGLREGIACMCCYK